MSYLDRTTDPNRRTTAITGVIVIHALLAYALVTGLVYTQAPRVWRDPQGSQFPLPTPTPPPKPTPQPSASPRPVPTPWNTPPNPLPSETPTPAATSTPGPGPTTIPTPLPSAAATHAAAYKPKPPVPKNDPKTWVTTDDYPSRDLGEENEGTTGFRVAVGTNGRVTGCEIVRSSGHPGIDAAACKAVAARARFAPATDENGDATSGSYSNSVRWQIPR